MCRVSGENWAAYLKRLAKAEGLDDPTDEDLRRFDRKRKEKKVSNAEWASPIDPDSRIMKMKDGRTRFSYKAEHAVDLESDLVVAAEIYAGDTADGASLLMTVQSTQDNLVAIGTRTACRTSSATRATTASSRSRFSTKCTACGRTSQSAPMACATTGASAPRATRWPSMGTGAAWLAPAGVP